MLGELQTLRKKFNIATANSTKVIALVGNPNTGKSTIFNALTGLRQHTGNWPGKTVIQAQGEFSYKQKDFLLVDLPGIYSLFPHSPDEQVARDFLCFAHPDITIAVADATCLERNLSLILQIIEITPRVVLCVNLMDEAKRKKIKIDINCLERELGIPVIPTVARNGEGIKELKIVLNNFTHRQGNPTPYYIDYGNYIEKRIKKIERQLTAFNTSRLINPRWLALRILEEDKDINEALRYYFNWDGEVQCH